MKAVKAVAPYNYTEISNFKNEAYKSWINQGGMISPSHYPFRFLHGVVSRYSIPRLGQRKKEARLRFVSGYNVLFDTFPDYLLYEIIPLIWDCWPSKVESVSLFFKRYNVQTAFFTSSQTAELFMKEFSQMNIFHITEGINTNLYKKGDVLCNRTIDILEIGRKGGNFFKTPLPQDIKCVKTGNFIRTYKTDEEFRNALSDTKITINVPRCDVDKKTAGNIETLTQRYWECMLSRIIMIGRAPKELIELIGYNPVIEWDGIDATPLVSKIINNISDYQELVDKNYHIALEKASWDIRMKQIMEILSRLNYKTTN